MPRLTVALLGLPRVKLDGAAIEVDTRKAIALIGYLSVTRQAHSRDTLAVLLWPDYAASKARGALRRTLSVLNKALPTQALLIERDSVQLRANADVQIDVEQFHQRLRETHTHGHADDEMCALCLAPLSEAVALYRGDFLEGFTLRDSANFDDWQFFQTESLRREFASVLERLVKYHSAHGEYQPAMTYARRLLALDPLHEPAQRDLIQLYAWSGQRAAALRQYRECMRILDAELGVVPLAETTELFEAIRQNRLPTPAPPDAGRTASNPQRPAPSDAERAASKLQPSKQATNFPFVGRARELALLLAAHNSIQREGLFIVIEGEAGIGKTRLAEELLVHARTRSAAVIATRCYEGEANLAYAPLLSALRVARSELQRAGVLARLPVEARHDAARLVPEFSDATTPADSSAASPIMQTRLFESISQIFLSVESAQPCVVFFDDVQWADQASLDWLNYAVRRLRDHRFCILVTWRSEDVTNEHRLRQLLGEAQRMGMARALTLARLDADSVAQLMQATTLPREWNARLYQETEGLPLFVIEYLSSVAHDTQDWSLPAGVRDLLRARLVHLTPISRQLFDTAAVIGRSFDFETLCAASGRSEMETVGALEELIAHGVIQEISDGALHYDFAHEKLRALVYAETSMARRRLLHRRVADALVQAARTHDASAVASVIARHYQLAGQPLQAAEYFSMAGEHARRVFAQREALHHFRNALALGHPDVAALHEAIGDVLTLQGEYSAALASYETAAALLASAEQGRIEHKLASVCMRRGEWDVADTHLRAALNTTETTSSGARARVLADRSLVAHQLHQPEQAWTLAQQSLREAEQADDSRARAQAHNMLGVLARHGGEHANAREHLQASLQLAERLNDVSASMAVLNNLALLEGEQGNTPHAIALTEHALTLCTKYGDRHREAALRNNLADLLHAVGQQDAAMIHLKQAVSIFAEIGAEAQQLQPEIWKLTEW